jgi:hypothetical protein
MTLFEVRRIRDLRANPPKKLQKHTKKNQKKSKKDPKKCQNPPPKITTNY